MGSSVIKFAREKFTDVCDEIKPLLEDHWQEIALNKDKIKLNPDWNRYFQMECAEQLAIFTMRDNGKMVGYFVIIMIKHLHYVDHVFAFNDIIFVHPSYRKGMNAIRFIKFCESEVKKIGASVLTINSKVHAPFGSILERIGYAHIEQIYSKALI